MRTEKEKPVTILNTMSTIDKSSPSAPPIPPPALAPVVPPAPLLPPADSKPQFEDNFTPSETNDTFVANFDDFDKKANPTYDRYAVFREIQDQVLLNIYR